MKHFSFLYSDKKSFFKAKKEAKKNIYKSILIQVFTSQTNKNKIQNILKNLKKEFPTAVIIGATTAGEISHAKIYENSTVISLSLFKKTTLKISYADTTNFNSGKKLSKKISDQSTKAAIILSEGLNGKNYENFLKGFKEKNPNVIIAGGLAGDNFKLKKTFVFLNDKVFKIGSVAVSFSGKKLFADNRYNLNSIPIGKEFTITSAKRNIVHKIDNIDTVEIFKKYLGNEIFDNKAKGFTDFQLIYYEGSTIVARTPMAVKNNSLIFAGPLKEGQKVQFGFANTSSLISGSNFLGKKISKNPSEAIYIYSCIARKTLIDKTLENEFKIFENIAPTAGFFTYGEYYSTNANNALLNCTTTILSLSENKKIKKIKNKNKKIKNNSLENATFNALAHFIKQTSIELKENVKLLNQYKDVVDKSSIVSKTDKYGIITYVNDIFCEVSKYSREELIGKNHNIVRDKNVPKFIFKKMWNTIKSKKIWRGKLPNKAKDNSIYYVDATIMPICDKQGNIQEYIAIRQNITKLIVAKKRLQTKEKFIKAMINNQNAIVIYSSKKTGIINANNTLFKYLDYKNFEDFKTHNKCICDHFLEEDGYVYPSKYPNWIDDISNNENTDYKVKIKIKDKTIHTFTLKIKKIDSEYIINLYDITTLENALFKAYTSEKAKAEFLANMSHEIRTPLNGILGFTDVLMKKDLEKDSKKYVDIIHKSGETLLNVVNDILDFSKLESGELFLDEIDTNLFEEMEASVSTFASTSRKNNINYYVYIDPCIPKTVKCDIQRLKQVTNNLISNAIKFTPEDGEVFVKILSKKIKNNKVKLSFSVKDSGIGIDKSMLSSIFQAFSQADNSISRKFGGTGLGLAISNQYINLMGSSIKVRSEIGNGSEFYFDLKFDIVNTGASMNQHFDMNKINIAVMDYNNNNISCSLTNVIYTYLNNWKCSYNKIEYIKQIDEQTNILIVCQKLFDKKSCVELLDKFEKLHIIYIEGVGDLIQCKHEKFHLIEQPMTGSSLFDTLIPFASDIDTKTLDTTTQISSQNKRFNGNILIAEDNETNQLLIATILQSIGLTYKIVNNGQEVIDEINSNNHYDIIFMDINMPVLDGISATKILRKSGYSKPIVSLSANVLKSDIEKFIESGIDDTLNKPLVTSELNNILSKYLTVQDTTTSTIKFDQVNIDKLSAALSLPNREIIIKLLDSFSGSAKKLIKKIEQENIDKDTLHTIKGLAGNLRFNELYNLVKSYEDDYNNWKKNEVIQYSKIVKSHLEKLIENIELIDK